MKIKTSIAAILLIVGHTTTWADTIISKITAHLVQPITVTGTDGSFGMVTAHDTESCVYSMDNTGQVTTSSGQGCAALIHEATSLISGSGSCQAGDTLNWSTSYTDNGKKGLSLTYVAAVGATAATGTPETANVENGTYDCTASGTFNIAILPRLTVEAGAKSAGKKALGTFSITVDY